jgi:hypothetical protein
VRFNRGESGLLAADRAPVFESVCYLLPPAEGDDGSPYGWKCTGHLAMAARSIEACSFHVAVSRRLSEGPNLSTYVKDTSAPAGGMTLLPYDSEAVRKVQNEPSRPQ